MVHYKLTYFDFRGLGDCIRQVFYLANVEFEDERIVMKSDEWKNLKPKTPFGHLPVLTVDGLEIPQSMAIVRYLSKKFGFAGKTPEEEAWVDAIVDQFKDFGVSLRPYIYTIFENKPADVVEKTKKEVAIPACENYLRIINKILEKSKSGFLVGDSLTFADLVVADNLLSLHNDGFIKKGQHPKLDEFQAKIHNLPELKDYIASRPSTTF
ncbi:unnamed protein product [Caenorhabditis angaria]|uniref:glutathione transferase n=1 Tax=Caenorhabditis angaria TaxID=860376 RepID=A0A9P1IB03_9PELO|nr:unnamed protein product [Caenorhabditis angaria]